MGELIFFQSSFVYYKWVILMLLSFFGSSLAGLEPKLELFDVNDNDYETNRHHDYRYSHHFQTALTLVVDKLNTSSALDLHILLQEDSILTKQIAKNCRSWDKR